MQTKLLSQIQLKLEGINVSILSLKSGNNSISFFMGKTFPFEQLSISENFLDPELVLMTNPELCVVSIPLTPPSSVVFLYFSPPEPASSPV